MELAVLYEKIVMDGTEVPTYMFKPVGVIDGKLDKKNKVFEKDGIKYPAYFDTNAITASDEVYFGRPIQVSLTGKYKGVPKKTLVETYYDKVASEAVLVSLYDTPISQMININELSLNGLKAYVDHGIAVTDPNGYVKQTVEQMLNIIEAPKCIDAYINATDFCRTLNAFVNNNEKIGSVDNTMVDEETMAFVDDVLLKLEEYVSRYKLSYEISPFDDGMEFDKYVNKLYGSEEEVVEDTKEEPKDNKAPEKVVEEEKVNHYDPNKVQYPEYSYDDMYKGITDVVIDQDEPVAKIVAALYKRLVELKLDPKEAMQFGMLVTGSTGVGKSEIFKTFSQIIDFPIQFIDSTQLTKQGYVGRNIEDYIQELIVRCNNDFKKVTKSIIIMDEVDKLKAIGEGNDVGGKAVQDMLLKFMDGANYQIEMDKEGPKYIVKSNFMTPISVGAFQSLYHKKTPNFGFKDKVEEQRNISTDDFVGYGMTEEFMGRHYIRVHLNDLNANSMMRILNESKKSPLKLQKNVFKKLGVDVRFTYEYKKLVVQEALKRNSGARALAGIIAESVWLPISEIDRNKGKYNKLIIGKDTMSDPKKYILRRD